MVQMAKSDEPENMRKEVEFMSLKASLFIRSAFTIARKAPNPAKIPSAGNVRNRASFLGSFLIRVSESATKAVIRVRTAARRPRIIPACWRSIGPYDVFW